jgi:hypothetical protein
VKKAARDEVVSAGLVRRRERALREAVSAVAELR